MVSVTMRSTVYLVADKWAILVCLRLILPEILPNSFWEAILLLCIHCQLMFGYVSLHSAILVLNDSFIMLVNILLFQHYSCQICNLLFSKLCQHNRLRPTLIPSPLAMTYWIINSRQLGSHCNLQVWVLWYRPHMIG